MFNIMRESGRMRKQVGQVLMSALLFHRATLYKVLLDTDANLET